jgi:hypothetical protein
MAKARKAGGTTVTVEDIAIERLHGAEWNPRTITDERLDDLKDAIMADPDFLWERPVLAMADGTVYAGNQRLLAAQDLGWDRIPAIMEDVPEHVAHERALRDNQTWGQWDDETLARQIQAMPADDRSGLGFSDGDMLAMLRTLPTAEPPTTADATDGTLVSGNEGERGKTPDQMIQGWQQGVVRNMVLYYPVAEYERVAGMLDDLRESMNTETNADVVLAAVEWGYAHHCASTEGAESE